MIKDHLSILQKKKTCQNSFPINTKMFVSCKIICDHTVFPTASYCSAYLDIYCVILSIPIQHLLELLPNKQNDACKKISVHTIFPTASYCSSYLDIYVSCLHHINVKIHARSTGNEQQRSPNTITHTTVQRGLA